MSGVVAGVFGIAKDGSRSRTTSPAWSFIGKYVLIAEGVRGSLAKGIIARYELSDATASRRNSASA